MCTNRKQHYCSWFWNGCNIGINIFIGEIMRNKRVPLREAFSTSLLCPHEDLIQNIFWNSIQYTPWVKPLEKCDLSLVSFAELFIVTSLLVYRISTTLPSSLFLAKLNKLGPIRYPICLVQHFFLTKIFIFAFLQLLISLVNTVSQILHVSNDRFLLIMQFAGLRNCFCKVCCLSFIPLWQERQLHQYL